MLSVLSYLVDFHIAILAIPKEIHKSFWRKKNQLHYEKVWV